MEKVSVSYLFSSQDIKRNVLLSSYLPRTDDVTNFKIYLDQPLKQWLTGGKRGEDGNTKI